MKGGKRRSVSAFKVVTYVEGEYSESWYNEWTNYHSNWKPSAFSFCFQRGCPILIKKDCKGNLEYFNSELIRTNRKLQNRIYFSAAAGQEVERCDWHRLKIIQKNVLRKHMSTHQTDTHLPKHANPQAH